MPNQPSLSDFRFVSSREMSRQLGISVETLKKYRLSGKLQEGIHYVRPPNQRKPVSFNLDLMLDWHQNRSDPAAHLKAVEFFQSILLSNQSKRSTSSMGKDKK